MLDVETGRCRVSLQTENKTMHINELLAQTIELRDRTLANHPTSQRLSILERDIQRLKRMGAK